MVTSIAYILAVLRRGKGGREGEGVVRSSSSAFPGGSKLSTENSSQKTGGSSSATTMEAGSALRKEGWTHGGGVSRSSDNNTVSGVSKSK